MSETLLNRPQLSKTFIEKQYNNRALVPNFAEILARWELQSKVAREARAYDTHRFGAQPNATLDLFAAANARALVIFIHGGYWRALTKDEFSFLAPAFVTNRMALAVLNYDLCPNTTVGGIIDQVVSALHYLDRVPRIPANWIIVGHSAGGHLTAAMWSPLAKLSAKVRKRIVGGMSISGIHDLDPMVDYSINAELRLTRDEAHRLSPAAYLPRIDAPLMVAAGGAESPEFHRQATLLHQAWPDVCQQPRAGLHFPKGLNHFTVMDGLCDPSNLLYKRVCGFLEAPGA